ncbi:MAG TPA: nitronate monooxygenase family protein [Caulobacteraceae bacterium]
MSGRLGSRTTTEALAGRLRLPVMAGPMFIASTAELAIAQCRVGIVGALPALNPRSPILLRTALGQITEALAGDNQAAPFAINIVAHRTNDRLDEDLAAVIDFQVPIVIVSLAAPSDIVGAVHAYGGLVFNDVISDRQARKCAEAGIDGLIAVAAGAGGHTGKVSPFALVQEIRRWWDGPLALSGCIATGRNVLAAQVMGADFAYIGSPFLASDEANTAPGLKAMIVASEAADVMVTDCFTGIPATFLRPSIIANGLDPSALIRDKSGAIDIKDGGANPKAWRDIWSAGQGIAAITRAEPAAVYVARLADEYQAARRGLSRLAATTPGKKLGRRARRRPSSGKDPQGRLQPPDRQ